jgi:acyl transferase domain-containing protein
MPHRIAFLYNSRESLGPGLARCLYTAEGAVRRSLEVSESAIRRHLGWSLEEALSQHTDEDAVVAAEHVLEPALTAVQIALTDAWRERGVYPDATAGRSAGELAAGYARGVLTHEQAIELACRLSRLTQTSSAAGKVLLVDLPVDATEGLLAMAPAPVHIVADAWINVTVIACAAESENVVLDYLREHNVRCRPAALSVGAHSPFVTAMEAEFTRPLTAQKSVQLPPVVGYTPAEGVDVPSGPDPASWWEVVVRRRLRIADMFRRMLSDGFDVFLEIGGRPSFALMIRAADGELGTASTVLATSNTSDEIATVMSRSLATLDHLGLVRAAPQGID